MIFVSFVIIGESEKTMFLMCRADGRYRPRPTDLQTEYLDIRARFIEALWIK